MAPTVKRFTFRPKDWSGIYRGVNRANYRDCSAGFKPTFTYDDGLVDIEHTGSSFRIDSSHPSCGLMTQELAGFSLD